MKDLYVWSSAKLVINPTMPDLLFIYFLLEGSHVLFLAEKSKRVKGFMWGGGGSWYVYNDSQVKVLSHQQFFMFIKIAQHFYNRRVYFNTFSAFFTDLSVRDSARFKYKLMGFMVYF